MKYICKKTPKCADSKGSCESDGKGSCVYKNNEINDSRRMILRNMSNNIKYFIFEDRKMKEHKVFQLEENK